MTKENRRLWTATPLLLLLATRSFAESPCLPLIQAADKALEAQKAQITIRDKELGQAEILLKSKNEIIAEQDKTIHAWYRSPYLYLFLGAAVGVYVGKR